MTAEIKSEVTQTETKIQPEIAQPVENKVEAVKEESGPPIKTEENQANWRQFRQDRERERKARQDAEEMAAKKNAEAEALKAAMDALLNKNQQPQQHEYSDNEETQDQIIERKIKQAIEKDRQRQREEQQKIDAQTYPQRLIGEHKDFNSVCTAENLDYLEYHYPEIATGYKYMPDGFEKWSNIYKAIKRHVPMNKKEDEARINKNMQKPQANLPTMTDTQPQTSSWRLTEERRRANWERMQKDRRSIG